MNEHEKIDRGPLIIVGASARAAAQGAIRAGFRPYAIDLFADLDLQRIAIAVQIERYPAEFLTALAAAPQAPWIYTGSLENYPRLVQRLAQLRPLVGNDAPALRKVRDPRWLAGLLAGSAVRYPETEVGGRRSEIGGRRSEVGGQGSEVVKHGDWLLKPIRSGGGMGIRLISDPRPLTPDSRLPTSDLRSPTSDLRSPISDPRPPTSDFCFQQRVAGQSISASFVATGGEVGWIGATEQWIGANWGAPQEFQYAGSLAPLSLRVEEQAALLDVARLLSKGAGLCGLFGLDLIRNEQGLWLIEVNPRYTASMELLEQLTGRQLIAEHFGVQGHDSQHDVGRHVAAKLIVYAKAAGSAGKSLYEAFQALSQQGILSADVPRLGTAFEAGNPICTLMTGGETREEIETKLHSAGEAVRRSLDQ